MISYEIQADLHPKKLTGIAIKKTQGVLFAPEFLPERLFPEWSGYYKSYGNVAFGQMAPEVAEGGRDRLLNTDYTESSFTMKEYRIGGRLSERAIKFLMNKNSKIAVSAGRQLVTDEIEMLADMLALREEYQILNEITSNAPSGNKVTASFDWSGTQSTPLKDLRTACKNILTNQHTQGDTLIISPDTELNLMNHADIKDIYKYSGNTTNLTAKIAAGRSRAIPNIAGLDVYVSDAVKTANTAAGILSGATETALVGDDYAIVCKRGTSLGYTYVAEPLEVRRWAEEETRTMRVQLFKTFVPVIFRTNQIATVVSI
uniref:Putative capsid protein n=1 Tax=viral metagenome TaxID=1070528 RepID=A0A6M3L5X9_9ZZZZ